MPKRVTEKSLPDDDNVPEVILRVYGSGRLKVSATYDLSRAQAIRYLEQALQRAKASRNESPAVR